MKIICPLLPLMLMKSQSLGMGLRVLNFTDESNVQPGLKISELEPCFSSCNWPQIALGGERSGRNTDSDSVSLDQGLRFCTSKRYQGDICVPLRGYGHLGIRKTPIWQLFSLCPNSQGKVVALYWSNNLYNAFFFFFFFQRTM